MMKKSKTLTAAAAVVLSAALALGGTYAWQSISQRALNEAASEPNNPGGRLHDDFDGTNKDIYVENFTDPIDGVPIYARVRLNEYMELGQEAGMNREAEDRKAASVMEGADINDMSTWKTFVLGEEGNAIHDTYWDWTMGGETVFMPTFNKNRDSLAADVNGTFAGPDEDPATSKDRYEDYVAYNSGDTVTGNAVYDADDNDADEGEDAVEGENINTVEETHTAKATQRGTVITMAQWKAAGANPGKFWVYDTDGWAYWAEAIDPGEATGLLLDGIELKEDLKSWWYYAIDVTGQFATAGDWGDKTEGTGFYEDGISEDALFLMNLVSGKLKVVTGEDGKQYIDNGNGTFQEKKEDGTLGDPIWSGPDKKPGNADDKPIIIGKEDGKNYVDNGDGTYSRVKDNGALSDPIYAGEDGEIGTSDDRGPVVVGEDGKKYVDNGDGTYSEIQEDGTLGDPIYPGADKKIGTDDDQTVTIIDPADPIYGSKFVGPNEDGSYYAAGPDGVFGTGDDTAKVWPNPTLTAGNITNLSPYPDNIAVTAAKNATSIGQQFKLQFSKNVTKNGEAVDGTMGDVTWSVGGATSVHTSIDETGLLTVGADEAVGGILTIRATSVIGKHVYGEYTVAVTKTVGLEGLPDITPGSEDCIYVDGIEWYVLVKDEENNRALLFSKYMLEKRRYAASSNIWRDSELRTYLNGEWLESKPTLKEVAIESDIKTKSAYNAASTSYITTQDRVFLVSGSDVEGASGSNSETCTYNTEKVVPKKWWTAYDLEGESYNWWTRTPGGNAKNVLMFPVNNTYQCTYERGVRPALWVPLNQTDMLSVPN